MKKKAAGCRMRHEMVDPLKTTAAFALAALVFSPCGSARAGEIEGKYVGVGEAGVRLQALIKRKNPSMPRLEYEVELVTTGPKGLSGLRCGGGAEASGRFNPASNRLIALAKNGTEICALVLDFRGQSLRVEESQGCFAFRGANCTFNGVLRRAGRLPAARS
jgi:hypothetical protein